VSYTSNVAGSLSNSKSIETGRIEKGESSNQSFETTYGSFNTFSTKEVKYKILPMSSKPIEGKDLKKYCTECGKKVKETFKFCPSCGVKV
jgi:rRNA maturation endonuclease Nob1